MVSLVDIAEAGAVEGVDCSALANQLLVNGAPGLYYPPGGWVQNDVDLTGGQRTTKMVVRGASPAVTRITSSIPGAGIFKFWPASAREAFLQIEELELCNGPAYPTNGQAGLAIHVRGPAGSEIGKGVYKNLWAKNWYSALLLERHNDASLSDILAEYCDGALYAVDCGDLDAHKVKAQNGTGWAIQLIGTPEGQTLHQAEGARLSLCSSNGQAGGLLARNYSFLHTVASSFSSAPVGALHLENVAESSFTGGEWQAGPDVVAMSMDAACRRNRLIGPYAYDSLRGLELGGKSHTVMGLHADGNLDVDVILQATDSGVHGGQLLSTGAACSLMEVAGAANNRINGVVNSRGIQLLGGNGSTVT